MYSCADQELALGKVFFFLCRKKGHYGDHILEVSMWRIHQMDLPNKKYYTWKKVPVVGPS